MALAKVYPVRRVLELGPGNYSTPLFLDREVFPLLERLESIENDEEWWEVLGERHADDPRFTITMPDSGRVADAILTRSFRDYDLILVDDSKTMADRELTIDAVLRSRPRLAVIHDYEHYSALVNRWFAHCFHIRIVDDILPLTAVLWSH